MHPDDFDREFRSIRRTASGVIVLSAIVSAAFVGVVLWAVVRVVQHFT